MNKAQLVRAVGERLGDQRSAAAAVDEVLAAIVRTVQAGETVTLTGFGVFERRERAARTGRNPRTGETLQVAATSVPAFRPGATFRSVVSGDRDLPNAAPRAGASSAAPAAPRRRPAPRSTSEAFAATAGAPAATVATAPLDGGKKTGKKSAKSGTKADKKPKKSNKGGKKRAKK